MTDVGQKIQFISFTKEPWRQGGVRRRISVCRPRDEPQASLTQSMYILSQSPIMNAPPDAVERRRTDRRPVARPAYLNTLEPRAGRWIPTITTHPFSPWTPSQLIHVRPHGPRRFHALDAIPSPKHPSLLKSLVSHRSTISLNIVIPSSLFCSATRIAFLKRGWKEGIGSQVGRVTRAPCSNSNRADRTSPTAHDQRIAPGRPRSPASPCSNSARTTCQ